MSLPEGIFPIGTTFTRRRTGNRGKVIDHLTTTNSSGEVVKFRYLVEYSIMGQPLRDSDVVHATIKMALAEQSKPA